MKSFELSEDLSRLLEKPSGRISVQELVQCLGDRGFGVALALFAIPSALPVPAPGYSIPLGVIIILISAQMMAGRTNLWLPRRILNWEFSAQRARGFFEAMIKSFRFFEKVLSPRQEWICAGLGVRLFGLLTLSLASLMLIPLPLTNTLPALVILMIGLGLSEDDGIFAVIVGSLGVLVLAFYVIGFAVGVSFGVEGLRHLWAGTN